MTNKRKKTSGALTAIVIAVSFFLSGMSVPVVSTTVDLKVQGDKTPAAGGFCATGGAGVYVMPENSETVKEKTALKLIKPERSNGRPPIDAAVPAETRTATFALG